jgi:hypothetical protein
MFRIHCLWAIALMVVAHPSGVGFAFPAWGALQSDEGQAVAPKADAGADDLDAGARRRL